MQLMRGGSVCETVVTSELAREHGHKDCLGHASRVCLHAWSSTGELSTPAHHKP